MSVDQIIHISSAGTPVAVPLSTCGLNDQSRRFVDRWLDVTKSNLLFSKGAILVEGIAEAIVIPELARIVLRQYGEGRDTLDDYGVSVINLGGIYFKHFMQLFCDVSDESTGQNVPVRCAGLALLLSFRKLAMVLKSGIKRPVSHINSTLRWASRSRRRLD